MKDLHISNDLSLPPEAVTNTHLILARRRVGKSYTAAVMAEEMVKAGLPWVALDPTGVWWGLTSSADGKSEGLPVIVIGGPHGHIPLEPSAGKVIANLVIDHPGWYVIDFSRFNNASDERRFSADFGVQLYRRKQRHPSALHLFVDEADMFVPQKLPKDGKPMFDAFDAIVRRGGVYGLGVTLITQRPAIVNKDVTTQCETLIALQTTAPQDQDPVFDWVSRNGTDVQLKEIKKTLAGLKVGQAWFFSPNSDVFQLIKIRTRDTFNSSATPKPGAKPIEPKVFANIDIQALGEEITATVERSKQEDPEFLRRQISQLQRDLAQKPSSPSKAEPVIERVEVPIISNEQLQTLEAYLLQVSHVTQEFREIRQEIEKLLNGKIDGLNTTALTLSAAIEAAKQPSKPVPLPARYASPVFTVTGSPRRQTAQPVEREGTPALRAGAHLPWRAVPGSVTNPQQRIIDAIAWLESIGLFNPKRTIIAFLAGQSPRSSGFTNNLGALRSASLITYPGSDSLGFTELGRAAANPQEAPITTEELQRAVLSRLPNPQARILRILIEHYPNPVNREWLAESAGQSPKSSGYTNNLGALRGLGVIDYPSSTEAVALPVLFLE
jgi:hypothetical protein